MKKQVQTKKPATRKTNLQQKRRSELNVGELQQVYGGLRVVDPGTKG